MPDAATRPWTVPGPEGRRARLDEVRRLAGEGLAAEQIAERMRIAAWIAGRDLETLAADPG